MAERGFDHVRAQEIAAEIGRHARAINRAIAGRDVEEARGAAEDVHDAAARLLDVLTTPGGTAP